MCKQSECVLFFQNSEFYKLQLQISVKMNNNINIVFDVSKDELFKLTDNMKTLHRKLKALYKIEM
jgi:hypothetical protein